QPQIVFHAAALKQVPMVEANPIEGVLTNVVGSRNVAETARAHGVPLVVMISTDKAVDPASVMGATKRLAEAICQALDLDEARRKIFVLEMGEPVRIVDLARQMIRLAGFRPERDIRITYIGLRPGEKLHETLFHAAESPVPTKNPALRLAAPRTADYAVLAR